MKSPPAARSIAVGVRRALLTVGAVLGLALASPGLVERAAAAPGSDLETLGAAAALVQASSSEIARLLSQGSPSPASIHAAGERLAVAGVALKQALAGYRSAKPYGSQQEAGLIARTLEQLLEARAGFGTLVDSRAKPPTPAAQEKVADQVLAGLRNEIGLAVDEHLGVTGLTEALSTGGLRGARNAIESQIRTALHGEIERQIKRLTGLGLALGVPVKEQLAIAAEQALVRLLAKIAAKSTPAGILVELIGSKVIHFVGDAIRKAFRGSGKLDSRTAKTLKGLENRLADLATAVASGDARRVKRVIGQAERALGATGFLKDDLKRKRRVELLDSIAAKESELRAAVDAAKEQFGIDSPLAAIDFGKAIDLVDKVVKEVNALNQPSCPIRPALGGGGCPAVPNLAGEWLGQDGGRYTITQVAGSRSVSWSACDSNGGTLWSHTFSGTITGGYLVGTFVDGPPGNLRNTGTLVLAIQGTSSLSWVASATIDGTTYTSFPTLTRQWSRGSHAGCSAPDSDFAITSVSYPTTVVSYATAATITVHWEGSPVFPVTAVYAPDSCPPGVNCTSPRQTFASSANPLFFAGAVGCWGYFPGPVVFDYSVYLEDATGKRTERRNADFTCLPS